MRRLHRSNRRITVLILGFFIFSCSHLGIHSKKEAESPSQVPECERNYTAEGIWPFNRVHRTWVKYDPFDYKKGFDTAVTVVKSIGCRTILADRDSGTISAEMVSESEDQKTYPVEIKLVKEKNALIIHLRSTKASGESTKERFCRFYKEFEKSTRRSQADQVAKQTSSAAKKSLESPPEQESESPSPLPSSPAGSATVASEATKPPPQPAPPPKALAKVHVLREKANVREGPGTNFRVVDRVKKGTPLTVLQEKEGWLYVRLESGREGWLSKTATTEEMKSQAPQGPPPSRPSSSPPSSSSAASPAVQSPRPASPM